MTNETNNNVKQETTKTSKRKYKKEMGKAKIQSDKKNHEKAIPTCKKYAEQGKAKALTRLGYCHDMGNGVEKDEEKAVEYYNNNFNCSQGVFTAFATEMGMDEKLALKLATNFGGGERKGELCGAVAGALMVLGLRCGHCFHPRKKRWLLYCIPEF